MPTNGHEAEGFSSEMTALARVRFQKDCIDPAMDALASKRKLATSPHRRSFVWTRTILLIVVLSTGLSTRGQEAPGETQADYVRGEDLIESGQLESGLVWLRRAATNGLLPAQTALASQLRMQGESARPEALHWESLAGQQGDAAAQTALINDLRPGDAVEYYREGWPWLQQMADRGDPFMMFRAGIWAYNGYGMARNAGLAFTEFMAANRVEGFGRQVPLCPYLAAYLLENGFGTVQNYRQAADLYWHAAEQGWPEAVYRLGLLLEHGQGVVADAPSAQLLYARAAELGNTAAAYRLGLLTLTGGSTLESRQTAFNWFLQAATNGFSMAQVKVGLAYEQDWLRQGADPLQALAWFTIAARSGNRGARIRQEDLARKISQQADLPARISRLALTIHPTSPTAMPGHDLLPASISAQGKSLIHPREAPSLSRPRRLSEVGLAGAPETNEVAMDRRNDVHGGVLNIYLSDLQDRVQKLVQERLTDYARQNRREFQDEPEQMEIILSYRLLSDGRVEDVEVLDTNLNDPTSMVFVFALQDSSPTPRWTPRLRAELNEDYQDLLLAFGKDSVLRISQ